MRFIVHCVQQQLRKQVSNRLKWLTQVVQQISNIHVNGTMVETQSMLFTVE